MPNPLPALFPHAVLPSPGSSAPRAWASPLAARASPQPPAFSPSWAEGALLPCKPAPFPPQAPGFQGALLGCCVGLSPPDTSGGRTTRPGMDGVAWPAPLLCPSHPRPSCWCLSGWGYSVGKQLRVHPSHELENPSHPTIPSRENVEQLALLANIQPLANIQQGSGNYLIAHKLTHLLTG